VLSNSSILITGATGFIGRALLSHLHDFPVLGIGLRAAESNSPLNYRSVDIRSATAVRAVIQEVAPSVVFHFAAFTSPKRNEDHAELAREINLTGTQNILASLPPSTHIVFLSTDKVFDGSDPCPNEESAPCPGWHYGALKLQGENLIKDKMERSHIFRLPIVHAEGEATSSSFVDQALLRLKLGESVNALENVQRCFVKLSGLLNLFKAVLDDRHYGVFHVGSEMTSYYNRIRTLCDKQGIAWQSHLIPASGEAVPMAQNLDTTKIKKLMGFSFD
jgi:dTDP-4-dehydrorhamnose reductase